MSQRDGDMLRCSFCGKSQHEVRKLIAGPTVYICNECVEVCLDIIAEDRVQETKSRDQILPKPQEVKKHLEEYVIGQESAKKKLSVACLCSGSSSTGGSLVSSELCYNNRQSQIA